MINLTRQMVSFGSVGTLGFLIDAAVFTLANLVFQNLYLARAISYLAAASSNWALNRRFTFSASNRQPVHEWGRFIVTQAAGGVVNLGVYAVLVSAYAFFTTHPIAAIAAGSVAGMAVNFLTAKYFVFGVTQDER